MYYYMKVLLLNLNVDETRPFCAQTETVLHCFLEGGSLQSVSEFLQTLFLLFKEVFSQQTFILGFHL